MRKPLLKNRATSVKANLRASLTFRMNMLFFAIFILFSILVFRLGYLQIVKGEDYVRALARTEEVPVNTSVPRGRLFDRNGRILVDNYPENAITYTKMQTTKPDEMLQVAKDLAKLIDQPTNRITPRDKLDFWILLHTEAAYAKVTEKEILKIRNQGNLSQGEIQQQIDKIVRERITEQELAMLTNQDLEVLAIYREMLSGYNLSPQIIKSENVTPEEFARVSERLSALPGVNTTTDWKRVKLSSLAILGRTTVPSKGIPLDKLNLYLARDYARNDRVGESYIESQYEELLQGQKTVVKNITNNKGEVVDTVTKYEGQPGKDLVLTLDSELQAETEKIVEKQLLSLKAMGSSYLLDRAFLVMMNPNTGEVLSMVGKKIERNPVTGKNEVIDYSYGAFTTAYEVGSTIKGATVLTGYSEKVISKGTVLLDEPIYLAGTQPKSSIFNRGGAVFMNDQMALERSSNVYMFKIAMKIGGTDYSRGMGLRLKEGTFQRMRNSYAQFGLGVKTGIDLPGEFAGVLGTDTTPGKVLDLAIGQFDTYTALQLTQYISTIANGGYRLQPRMLKEIHEPSNDGETLGPLVSDATPTVLNRIKNSSSEINHVKEGLRRVYFGSQGSAKSTFGDAKFTAAGKTGTAEVVYFGPQREYFSTMTVNLTHVGFAPYDKPEIAYAVLIPWVTTNFNVYLPHNNVIARQAVEKYFELKKKNQDANIDNKISEQKILPAITDDEITEDEEE